MNKIKNIIKHIIILFSILGTCLLPANNIRLTNNYANENIKNIAINSKISISNSDIANDKNKNNDIENIDESNFESTTAHNEDNDEIHNTINADSLLDDLDLSALETYFNSLSEEQKNLFGGSIIEFIKSALNGNVGSYDTFGNYILNILGISVKSILPTILTIIAIAILVSLLGGMRGSFASKSVDDLVHFAGITVISLIVIFNVFSTIRRVGKLISTIKIQMETIFPILFTLMSALGASGSIAVYQPAVALLSFGVTQIISTIILPLLIVMVVFAVVGNLSSSIRLNGMCKFLSSLVKWLLGTSFFIFLGFLSVKGITATVYDNLSVRTAKFALSKYVPVIGGYLSEGFNLVLAGTVLVKNAIGSTSIILLFVSMLPILIEVIVISLGLKLASALVEPFANERICKVLNEVSSCVTMLSAVIIGTIFSYFVFLILLVCSGNLVL